MPKYNLVMPDVVALVVLITTGVLAYHGTLATADFKDLAILVLGYVFGTGKSTILR